MASTLYVVAITAIAYALVSRAYQLRAGIAKARKTGLPYIVVPWSPFSFIWQLSSGVLVPIFKRLPARLLEDWFFILEPDWAYKRGQRPFERIGDSFLTVTPRGVFLTTQDPHAIHQITARREHFPKPVRNYGILELFGRNLLTTEGAVWRLHRKATSSSFNERNTAHTFAEAIRQTQCMLAKWTAQAASPQTATITSVEHDTMTLALNIIGYVGFGLRMTWPGQAVDDDQQPQQHPADAEEARMQKYVSTTPLPGHSLTFAASVERVLHRIFYLAVLPRWLLRVLGACLGGPFREAYQASTNFTLYMRELLADKTAALHTGEADEGERQGMDLMGQLVRSRHRQEDSGASGGGGGGGGSSGELATPVLTDDEIIGNAFIMLVAGHETTANTLHFTLIQLAANPASQRAVQADVDRLLDRDSDPASWGYEASIHGLLASMLGAAMNETLRLMPPVVYVPKSVTTQADQLLTLTGLQRRAGASAAASSEKVEQAPTTHVLPAGIGILLSAVSAHRHPAYWPTQPSRVDPGKPTDLDDYVPERWLRKEGGMAAAVADAVADHEGDEDDKEDNGPGAESGAQLFHPVRGSFVPFSDGPRSCLGRRIAQVEMLAALAVVFQRYSLELAVDDLDGPGGSVDDATVAAMDPAARIALYARAQARARAILRSATSRLTLRLHGAAAVPLRLVPRGQERFVHIVDV